MTRAAQRLERFTLPGAEHGFELVAVSDEHGAEGRCLLGDVGSEREPAGCSAALLRAASRGGLPAGEHGELIWLSGRHPVGVSGLEERRLDVVQTNASYVVAGRVLVKWYRRVDAGVHPEAEALTALDDVSFPGVPGLHGVLQYRAAEGRPCVLAVAQEYLPDSWNGSDAVHRWLDYGDTGRVARWCHELGGLLARVHMALAKRFGIRRLDADDLERWRGRALARVRRSAELAGSGWLSRRAPEAVGRLERLELGGHPLAGRLHGDAHLGQFLTGRRGTRIIDFEGDPLRSPPERRAPDVTLRDVSCLLRGLANLHAWRELRGLAAGGWLADSRNAALDGYRAATSELCPSAPLDLVAEARWLHALELEKACEELLYARRHAPDWTPVAEAALDALLDGRLDG